MYLGTAVKALHLDIRGAKDGFHELQHQHDCFEFLALRLLEGERHLALGEAREKWKGLVEGLGFRLD